MPQAALALCTATVCMALRRGLAWVLDGRCHWAILPELGCLSCTYFGMRKIKPLNRGFLVTAVDCISNFQQPCMSFLMGLC